MSKVSEHQDNIQSTRVISKYKGNFKVQG